MRISLNWIKQYTQSKLSGQQLIKLIGERLAEVESVVELGPAYEGIVVAEILTADFHPNADRLGVYKVKIGRVVRQVVAGDRTLQPGDRVAYIPTGKIVPSQFFSDAPEPLQAIKIRGVQSNGMLASAKELMFGDSHEGVLKLDSKKPIGTNLVEAYELDDYILTIDNKTLTHRPDCFGVIGFAREVSGIQGLGFHSPKWLLKEARTFGLGTRKKLKLEVSNQIEAQVPTYLAVALSNVTVRPSPIQLQSYLARVDIRPINNVVDITNYLMIATGQPLHAFDYDKIKNHKLIIRHPKSEKLELLDGQNVRPDAKASVISDEDGLLALGGIMGGSSSEVSITTKNVVIEAATFTTESIRRTSQSLGIQSEAVTRFSRGQSPSLPRPVLIEAVQMLEEIVGAKQGSAIIGNTTHTKPKEVLANKNSTNGLLGTNISLKQMASVLGKLEIEVKARKGQLKVTPPYWRKDINIWQDIAEDIGRLTGFNKIKPTIKQRSIAPVRRADSVEFSFRVRNILVSAGANELLTYSGISEKMVQELALDTAKLYRIKNSRSPALKYMRPSLLPSLLDKVHMGHKQGYDRFVLFEIGAVHDKTKVHQGLPDEQLRLAVVFSDQTLRNMPAYYHAKHWLEYLLDSLGVDQMSIHHLSAKENNLDAAPFAVDRAGKVKKGKLAFGYVGEFKENVISQFKLPVGAAGFEVNLNELIKMSESDNKFSPIPRYPEVQRDVTYELEESMEFSDIFEAVQNYLDQLKGVSYSLKPLDIYQASGGNKRISLTLRLWHQDQTFSSSEVNKIVENLSSTLSKTHKAKQI